MKIAHTPAQVARQPRAVAIGTFDGVHRGHRSVVQAAIGPPASSWIHFGLTSSDIVDTAGCWALRDSADLLIVLRRSQPEEVP